MATFKAGGHEWSINLDAPTIMMIREAEDGDPAFLLGDQHKPETNTYKRLTDDPILLCRVIYLLCKKEREQRNISEADFYRTVIGDAIDDATDALLKAILSFTPRRNRELLQVTAAKLDKVQQIGTAKALEKLNDPALVAQMTQMIEDDMAEAMKKALTRRSNASSSPASVASIQPA